jgi:hypothetical protein
VKRLTHTDGNAEDSVMLISKPTQQLHRLPGVGLFYDGAIAGVPHPLVALVRVHVRFAQTGQCQSQSR